MKKSFGERGTFHIRPVGLLLSLLNDPVGLLAFF
jgi:hypothetical protein